MNSADFLTIVKVTRYSKLSYDSFLYGLLLV
jgi:hypothetical protein